MVSSNIEENLFSNCKQKTCFKIETFKVHGLSVSTKTLQKMVKSK